MKFDWKLALIILAGVVAVGLLCIFGVQSSQNKAFDLEEQVSTAKSDINIQEKRRADLIPNLVDCVKQYDKHEYETLMAVIEARGTSSDAAVSEIQTMIAAVSEAYPELKSNENYKQLMNELSITENLIAQYRENYNKQIKEYNRYVRKFPTRMFLDWLGYETIEYEYLEFDNVSSDAPTNLFD
jgi:LemA protein